MSYPEGVNWGVKSEFCKNEQETEISSLLFVFLSLLHSTTKSDINGGGTSSPLIERSMQLTEIYG